MRDEEDYAVMFHNDITWCGNSNECIHKDCFRNQINYKSEYGTNIFTISYFKNTEICPYNKEK
jgi:hypothetical protein